MAMNPHVQQMVATFPRVIGDELTVFRISAKSWQVLATIMLLNEE